MNQAKATHKSRRKEGRMRFVKNKNATIDGRARANGVEDHSLFCCWYVSVPHSTNMGRKTQKRSSSIAIGIQCFSRMEALSEDLQKQ